MRAFLLLACADAQIKFTCDVGKEVAKHRNLQNLKLLFDGRRVGNATLGPLMRKTGSTTMQRFAGPSEIYLKCLNFSLIHTKIESGSLDRNDGGVGDERRLYRRRCGGVGGVDRFHGAHADDGHRSHRRRGLLLSQKHERARVRSVVGRSDCVG